MYTITALSDRASIEAAWSVLAWTDPSPALAVDSKEEGRTAWRLDAYAATAEDAEACQALVAGAVPGLTLRITPLEDRDWVALSLEGLPAVRAGRFHVAGAHTLAGARTGIIPIEIEAGPAFGTGHHGTTLGCLLAYNRLYRSHAPRRVLDIGTGTGVLAIAALKHGARRAIATDIDAGSVTVTLENARKNRVGRSLKARVAFGIHQPLVRRSGPYDLVFANILARPLVRLSPDLGAMARPGGHIILSGLLNHQAPLVRKAYAGHGLSFAGEIRRDGWSTLMFRKPALPAGER